jgi:hypothetical protein
MITFGLGGDDIMAASLGRNRLVLWWLLAAGVGLALFFTGEYRDLELPLGGWAWFRSSRRDLVQRGDARCTVACRKARRSRGGAGRVAGLDRPGFVGAVIGASFLQGSPCSCRSCTDPGPRATVKAWPVDRHPVRGLAGAGAGARSSAGQGTRAGDERDTRIELAAAEWGRAAQRAFCV